MASMNIKPYPIPRAKTWGLRPFVIQPPTNKELLDCWISSADFLAMPARAKRLYACKFQVPDFAQLDIQLLDTMFTKYNEKLPMLDILQWSEVDGKKVLEFKATATTQLFEPDRCREGPDHPKYAPWYRGQIFVDEMLQPAPDDIDTSPSSPEAESHLATTPQVITKHKPLNPSFPIAEKHSRGTNAHRPTNDTWLYDMLQEQEKQHNMLMQTFQEALHKFRKAVMDVSLLQEQLKAEKKASDDFLNAIVEVCGEQMAGNIIDQTERGIKTGNIFSMGERNSLDLLGLQELYNKLDDVGECDSCPEGHGLSSSDKESISLGQNDAQQNKQNGEDHFTETSAQPRQGADASKNTCAEKISSLSNVDALTIPMVHTQISTSHLRLKRLRNRDIDSDEDSDTGTVASLLFGEDLTEPPRKKPLRSPSAHALIGH